MLQGAFNFRDLGGHLLKNGNLVRTGRLFRSDTLQALTPDDVAFLRGRCRVRAVIDLRLRTEVEEEGHGLLGECNDVTFVNSPLEMAATEGIAPGEVLNRLYERCLLSDSLPAAVTSIAAHAGHPTLFHCAAGKDRTGIVAAVVLRLIGVAEETIVADYMLSRAAMPRMIERFKTWPRYRDHIASMPPEVYAVEEAPIRRLLSTLDDQFGGVEGWARQRGIEASTVERLTHFLVRPA